MGSYILLYILNIVYSFGIITELKGLPRWCSGKESSCNAGDTRNAGSVPESGRSPGVENGNPLQYPGLENSMDRRAWQVTVHGVSKSQT